MTNIDRLHFKMFLFGQRYDAPRLWSAVRWDRELHSSMYYHARDEDEFVSDSEVDSDADEDGSSRVGGWEGKSMAAKRWKWWTRNVPVALQGGRDTVLPLGTTCKTRSTLYHHLLHYKFRLLLKVRDKVRVSSHHFIYLPFLININVISKILIATLLQWRCE